jgi:hypothetical protein
MFTSDFRQPCAAAAIKLRPTPLGIKLILGKELLAQQSGESIQESTNVGLHEKLSTPTSLPPCRPLSMSTMDATRGWDLPLSAATGRCRGEGSDPRQTAPQPCRNQTRDYRGNWHQYTSNRIGLDSFPSSRPARRPITVCRCLMSCWPRVGRQVAQYPRLQHLFSRETNPQRKSRDRVWTVDCGLWDPLQAPEENV